ncbi:site-specific integrase [Leptolyngbyaceae cyanobacterium CCMR0082]|uniref:Site-specific integrase n=1 Tax=Adonisia turfae CCMR0082 TaxID=2304604 RepID=A0A6M0SE19_9CYAN|nr:site-specific integrase [Adonisia turfae]MDV3348563.1 site-specific integrase [Leptothoe sp. LEGE 181152]NEZ66303.1 site-specific integrase [Adonisia turfae CCMR0082]
MADVSIAHSIDKSLAQVNQRLKAAKLGLQIERRGDRLNLRGTLPPRPGSPKLRPYQQRVPLKLPATKAGLKQCEQTAKIIAAQLLQNTFDWRNYLGVVAGLRMAGADLSAQIDAFEQYFFETRRSQSSAASLQTTWEKAYVPYLRKLQATAEHHRNLSLPEAIYATVQSTKANSRSRQICCTALAALAEFLNLDLPTDLKSFWGNYGNSHTQLRELPSDEQIIEVYDSLKNPRWQYVYGMMATYGLRNHEVFFCDRTCTPNAEIIVRETTKTGHHEVWPFYPEWVERFNLTTGELPNVNTDLDATTLQRVGQQVTTQFRRYKIPFSPYDLRHAWAVRTILMGLPDAVAARMMGHSVQVHNRTYHRWMTYRDQQAAVQAALAKNEMKAPM